MIGLRYYPDPILREICKPVTVIDQDLRELAATMIEIMYEAKGVGLAAPQVGVAVRMFVMDVEMQDANPQVLINPVISSRGKEKGADEEGCLSFPKLRGMVTRPLTVTVEAQDLTGAVITYAGDELLARCMQHEIDHLEGILFIDKLGQASRFRLREDLRKLEDTFSNQSA